MDKKPVNLAGKKVSIFVNKIMGLSLFISMSILNHELIKSHINYYLSSWDLTH